MQKTTNYNLNKPDDNDLVDVNDLNTNFDIIDQQIKTVEKSRISGGEVSVYATSIDFNNMDLHGETILSNGANAPASGYYWCTTYLINRNTATVSKKQIALGYIGNDVWTRYRYFEHAAWGAWRRIDNGDSGTLANGTDLNTLYKSNTRYVINGAYTYNHAPYTWGILTIVNADNAFVQQTMVGISGTKTRLGYGISSSGVATWGAWI